MEAVYIETSVVSHATAWPSKDPLTAVLQQQARAWLERERANYRLVISQFVLDEAATGDSEAARLRLELIAGLEVLVPSEKVEQLAAEILRRSLIPLKAKIDALHVASAAVGGVKYLLTQNCRHIANAHVLPRVYDLLAEFGFSRLLICTPAEFLGGTDVKQPNP